jgi:hypothetical protein
VRGNRNLWKPSNRVLWKRCAAAAGMIGFVLADGPFLGGKRPHK